MNAGGESRKEAPSRMAGVLNAKISTKIGFWNVRSMFEAGKLAQVTNEMKRYQLDILGLSETRWTGQGRFRSVTGESILYSGRNDNLHYEGVAFILKKGVSDSILEWKPINSRLAKLRLKGKQINTTIIQCYSPTNDSDEEKKDEFYEQLQAEIENTPRHDMKIIMGDLNAKVGNDNTDFPRTIGNEGCGTMNNNGERLLEMCESYGFVIGGTLFKHKEIHKLTWFSPNGRDKNQIDHFMINGTWRRSLHNVVVRRGADVGSDHQLVVATVQLKLHRIGKKEIARFNFDTEKLKTPHIRNNFKLTLKNKFEALSELEDHTQPGTDEVELKWNRVKKAYLSTAEECLGKKKRNQKQWITDETWNCINKRRETKKKSLDAKSERIKEQLNLQYQEENREVKRRTRNDKRKNLEDLATQAEEAAQRGEQGQVYRITKIICGKFKGNMDVPIKGKDGKLLTTETDQEKRWNEHFNEVLNRPPPETQAEITPAEEDLEIDIEPPRKEEIIKAIKTLKNRKAPGQDNLCAELFKTDPEQAADILLPLFKDIWVGKEVPKDWDQGIIIKIPKKGNLQDCSNWRGITLLSIPSKILAKVIINRLSDAIDPLLRKEQAGFRKERGCTEQIFALRNIIEQCTEWQRQLYINFIDFEKAFDSLHRDSLWKILRAYGIPQDITLTIKSFYNNFTCKVGNSDLSFHVKTGVRQGCVMSAMLFNIAIDWVMKNTTSDISRGIRWTVFSTLEDLDFADDLALLSHTAEQMQEKTKRLADNAGCIGLKISKKKSEVMTLNVENPQRIKVSDEELPITEEFTYLGSTVTNSGGAGKDITNRIGKARNTFYLLNNVWKSQHYGLKTKLRIYNSCVLSTLLYGSECWRMTDGDERKLSVFHTKCLRRIKRIFWPQRISNEELLRQCEQDSMETILMKKRWRWIGHTLRRDHDHIARVALHWTPEGKRKRGRPRNTWRRTVEAEMKAHNETWGTVTRKAQNRQEWRSFVDALIVSRQERT